MIRRVLTTILGLGLLAGLLDASPAGASVGTLTLDHRTGIVTWSTVVGCVPGDDVEVVVYLTQANRDASMAARFLCPPGGEEPVSVTTIGEENDRLRPGPTDVHLVQTVYPLDEWGEVGEVTMTESRSQVKFSPHHE